MPAATPPAVRERFRDDDRILELGCGVAGQLLCTLRAFPGATAVGVERSADLAAEARRRSQALGVADRLDVIVGDAATVRLEGEFDVVAWSQFFFPSESRAGALATAYAALRPGGLIVAPLLAHDPSDEAESFRDRGGQCGADAGGPRRLGGAGAVGRGARRGSDGRWVHRRGGLRDAGNRHLARRRHPSLTGYAIPALRRLVRWDA